METEGIGKGLADRAYGGIELYLCDCMDLMRTMPDGSVDIVLTDPPYMYLNHRLDAPFDIERTYSEIRRVLCPERGAIVVFGRGPSFYRTGALLESMGLRFLEEVVWHKGRRSSPVTPIGRVHETASIWGAGSAKINRVRVPVAEKYAHCPERMASLVREISKVLRNEAHFEAVCRYFETGDLATMGAKSRKSDSISLSSDMRNFDRRTAHARIIAEGGCEESVIRAGDPDFYNRMHPTQKPLSLLKRLLELVLPMGKAREEVLVLDPFGGSFSTMAATMDMGLRGMSCEILPDYFERGAKRIEVQVRMGRQLQLELDG